MFLCVFLLTTARQKQAQLLDHFSAHGHPWAALFNAFTVPRDNPTLGDIVLRDPASLSRRTKDPMFYRSVRLEPDDQLNK